MLEGARHVLKIWRKIPSTPLFILIKNPPTIFISPSPFSIFEQNFHQPRLFHPTCIFLLSRNSTQPVYFNQTVHFFEQNSTQPVLFLSKNSTQLVYSGLRSNLDDSGLILRYLKIQKPNIFSIKEPIIKGTNSGLRQFLTTESLVKMLKALFVLEIFIFFS